MDSKLNIMVAIIAIASLPALTIYAWQNAEIYTQQNAIETALTFMENAPTYKWDGISDTIQVIDVYKTRTTEAVWEIQIKFTSAHSGYGDRTGQVVLDVETEHIIKITVENDQITEALIDDTFDELESSQVITDDTNPMEADEIALDFLKNAPTYRFDGIKGTLKVVEVNAAESYPVQYFITIKFDSSHAGYGDRTDQILAQVITHHTAKVLVLDGMVRRAILDAEWDEIAQRGVNDPLQVTPEEAKDLAIEYVQSHYSSVSAIHVPDIWTVSYTSLEGRIGATTTEYQGSDWTITLNYAVIAELVYDVKVEYHGPASFTWEGQIDHKGNVTESH